MLFLEGHPFCQNVCIYTYISQIYIYIHDMYGIYIYTLCNTQYDLYICIYEIVFYI